MNVGELINILETMPKDAKVFHIWDGEPRTAIDIVYLSKSGSVMTIAYNSPVYSEKARPLDDTTSDSKVYYSIKNPKGYCPEDEWDVDY